MGIMFTSGELLYVTSHEFQNPVTRAEKRRAKHFMESWKRRAGKDALFQQEVARLLTGINDGTVDINAIVQEMDDMMKEKPSEV